MNFKIVPRPQKQNFVQMKLLEHKRAAMYIVYQYEMNQINTSIFMS